MSINLFTNVIEDKEIFTIVFLNGERDFDKACNIIYDISKKKYIIKELGVNAYTFIETDRDDHNKFFTSEELLLSQLMFFSISDEHFYSPANKNIIDEFKVKRARRTTKIKKILMKKEKS